jgi:WD40 repeat protein
MKPVCFAFLMAAASLPARAEPSAAPILRIDAGTHVTQITRIAVDRQGRFIATGSYDQTIRLWSLPGLELIRTVRLPIDLERQGAIYGLALSPDSSTIAAGGWTGGWSGEGDWCIYIVSVADGSLRRTLCGLPHRVMDLAYSADGRYLASTMKAGLGLRVYRTGDYGIAAEDGDYGGSSNWVEFDKSGRLVTAALDGKVRLYDPQFRRIAVRAMPEGRIPFTAAFSPDGTKIAVGYGEDDAERVGAVDVISGQDLSPLFRPDLRGVSNGYLSRVAWSSDGRSLYAGGTFQSNGKFAVRRWTDEGRGRGETLRAAAPDRILHLASVPGGGLAFTGVFPYIGLLGRDDRLVGERRAALADYRGIADQLAVSADGLSVQFAFEASGTRPAHFSLATRTMAPGAAPERDGLFRPRVDAAGLEVRDWDGGFRPKLNGRPIVLDNYEQALSLAIDHDGGAFVLGTIWRLRRIRADGEALWSVRVPAPVLGMTSTPDRRLLVAALGDGTLRWYALKDGKWLAAVLPHPDEKRWVAWTSTGYFDASAGGDGLIGWHVNRGREQAADFFPAARFRGALYRPEVVAKTVELLDEAGALKSRGLAAAVKNVSELLPPVIEIVAPGDGATVDREQFPVEYRVRTPSGEAVTEIRLLRNGRQVGTFAPPPPAKGAFGGTFAVLSPPADHELVLLAANRHTVSEPARIRLHWRGAAAAEARAPNLFVLAVGVSDYVDKELKLEYPANDARSFVKALESQEGRAFAKVTARILADGAATRAAVESELAALHRSARPDDLVVVFIAGHGVDEAEGGYHFLPVDTDIKRIGRTALPYSVLKRELAAVRANVVLFIDTCHSGDAFGRRGATTDVNRLVNDLTSAEYGMLVFAASTGEQVAFESPAWGNGAFTKAVIEGLSGEAAYRGRPYITAGMLDVYVSERVKELTGGRQTPVSGKPLTLPDVRLALIKEARK